MDINPSVRARVFMAGLVRSTRAARRHGDRGVVVALIAVHDEDEQVEVAIRSLKAQGSPPSFTTRTPSASSTRTQCLSRRSSRRPCGASGRPDIFVAIEKDGHTHS
jgi:hypothetical protein